MKRAIACMVLLVVSLTVAAIADIPLVLDYQGVLTEAGGTAVTDGTYDVTFRLYTDFTGGTHFWQETNSVVVTKGIFNVVLGTLTSLNFDFDETYYMGMSVEGEPELVPRIMLTPAAYSFSSRGVYGAENVFPSQGDVGVGTAGPGCALHVYKDWASSTSIIIENPNTSGASMERLILRDESGENAGLLTFDDDHVSSPSYMHLFNNRTNGEIHFITGAQRRMRIVNNGDVGIGTVPVEKLDVSGGIKIGSTGGTNAGTIRWTGADFEGYDGSSWNSLTASGGAELPPGSSGQTLRHDGADWTATSNLYNNGSQVGIGTTSPGATLHVSGSIRAGSNTQTGSLDIFRIAIATSIISLSTGSYGASQYWNDEAGTSIAGLYADPSSGGEGGYFFVKRSGAYSAFRVDGNYNDTESPRVSIFGASRSAVFDMTQAGNSSVSLPVDAVSSTEINNEPGVASYTEGGGTGTIIGTTVTVIGSRSIVVPAAGYVLVMASGQVTINHTNGTDSYCQFGVSDNNTSFPANQEVTVGLNDTGPSGYHHMGSAFHGLFEVAGAGTYTYYFLGDETSGDFRLYDAQLTLLYIPTSYGTVMPTVQGVAEEETRGEGRPGMTASAVAAERAESEAANVARIERELAAMRAELEALKEEMRED